MYNAFFGLRKKPFNMTPDPGFLFLTKQHREALAGITYAILDHKGFVVLTGDAGTGKTTLLARVLECIPASRMQSSVILNPTLTTSEFLEQAMLNFGISDIPVSKAQRLAKLQRLLLEGQKEGKVSMLVIDEAHKLSLELLEEIRLLSNFENGDQKLLQTLLIGQNELDELLERGDLRQLKQRIALRFTIGALPAPEVEQYIQYRWSRAGGGEAAPFEVEAVAEIACYSQGIPRVINAVCDNALMQAFGETSRTVTPTHVREAAADLRLTQPAKPLPVPVPLPVLVPVMTAKAIDATVVAEPLTLPTLERYTNKNGAKRSFITRWAGRLGLAAQ